MSNWLLTAVGTTTLISAPPEQPDPVQTYLVSITGIPLGDREFVDSFTVETWGVTYLSVCRFPPGWEVRAGRQASQDGLLSGQASHGVTFIDRARLDELTGLALVEVDGPVAWGRQGNMPPTFAGTARIGRYGTDESRRELRLTEANIRVEPASRCPDPEVR